MELTELIKTNSCMGYYDTRSQLQRYIYSCSSDAFKSGDKRRDSIASVEELEKYRNSMRMKFKGLLGGLPPDNTPLNPIIKGTIVCDGFTIEKVIFESRPRCYVTGNLYLPESIKGPAGAVLFLCGHAEAGKQYAAYQTVCQYLVRSGLAVFAQDPVGQGERQSYYEEKIDGTTIKPAVHDHDYAGQQSLLLGDSPARYFIHDAMRSIDYLCTRPEVNSSRIGITGSSGGGTQTAMMMICDERIAAAAPTNFIMDRESYMYAGGVQDSEQLWPGYTAYGFDHEDILLCMAPKPVSINAVKYDFFPIEGTRRTVERAKRFWEMYDRKDCIRLIEDESAHAYTKKLAAKTAEFFSSHLNGIESDCSKMTIKPLSGEKLWCTSTGQVKREHENARFIYEENLSRLEEITVVLNAASAEASNEKAREWIKEKVYYNRRPCALNLRLFNIGQVWELGVQRCMWRAQEGLYSHALYFRHFKYCGEKLPVTVAVWNGGTSAVEDHMEWLKNECLSGRGVIVTDVSGTGCLEPYPANSFGVRHAYGTLRKFSDDLIWLNDSMPALRTYDVIKAVEAVRQFCDLLEDEIYGFGYGRYAVYMQLAAFIDSRIKKISMENALTGYSELVTSKYYNDCNIKDIIFPGILKYTDINKWLRVQEEF